MMIIQSFLLLVFTNSYCFGEEVKSIKFTPNDSSNEYGYATLISNNGLNLIVNNAWRLYGYAETTTASWGLRLQLYSNQINFYDNYPINITINGTSISSESDLFFIVSMKNKFCVFANDMDGTITNFDGNTGGLFSYPSCGSNSLGLISTYDNSSDYGSILNDVNGGFSTYRDVICGGFSEDCTLITSETNGNTWPVTYSIIQNKTDLSIQFFSDTINDVSCNFHDSFYTRSASQTCRNEDEDDHKDDMIIFIKNDEDGETSDIFSVQVEFTPNYPTSSPTSPPSKYPTQNPSNTPSNNPTRNPSIFSTHPPSRFPTRFPTSYPSRAPIENETSVITTEFVLINTESDTDTIINNSDTLNNFDFTLWLLTLVILIIVVIILSISLICARSDIKAKRDIISQQTIVIQSLSLAGKLTVSQMQGLQESQQESQQQEQSVNNNYSNGNANAINLELADVPSNTTSYLNKNINVLNVISPGQEKNIGDNIDNDNYSDDSMDHAGEGIVPNSTNTIGYKDGDNNIDIVFGENQRLASVRSDPDLELMYASK